MAAIRLLALIRHYPIGYDRIVSAAIHNRVQDYRATRGWSQDELARRSGLSRTAISAVETDRVVPSTAAALALAAAFDCRVEDLFSLGKATHRGEPEWAWPSPTDPCRFWRAVVAEQTWLYPVERTFVGTLPPDGVLKASAYEFRAHSDPDHTLVLAGCDPAVGLLAAELARSAGVRLLPLIRSSRQALDLLCRGVVHVAGLHLQDHDRPGGNERAVREMLGPGYTLLRVSRWQEGLALAPGLGISTIRQAVSANLRWVGREPGSGARRCLDSILKDHHPLPKGYNHIAVDHTGVVETIRSGWAQAGVCVRLSAAEAGLDFLVAREEDYDLCYRSDMEHDPRIQALVRGIRSHAFRRSVGELPGYHTTMTGEQTRLLA
jgi:molybdate-binding protein/DNA-binding XRE family transcriptional regulator